ncbi:MAG: hypothetical protein JWQ04_967 [Pedosphaera sp.]|nr:hypothetical protein [Pedosphaera sp.]
MLPKHQSIIRIFSATLFIVATVASACAQSVSQPPKGASIRGEPIDAAAVKPVPVAASQAASASVSGTSLAAKPLVMTPTGTNEDVSAKAGGYLNVGFDKLASFNFAAPDTQVTNQPSKVDEADKFIPDAIKRLDGKKVMVTGFMLPLRVEVGKVKEFLIMRNQAACCFGTAPMITEFMTVKASGKGVDAIMDVPVNVAGILHVGTVRDHGYITEIYQMDGEKIDSHDK